MTISEISKNGNNLPMDPSSVEDKSTSKSGIVSTLTKSGMSDVDTLSQTSGDSPVAKNIPSIPSQPRIDDPQMDLVLDQGKKVEEAFRQNPLFATESRMNDFFVLMSSIMQLLSENRMLEDNTRRDTRQSQYGSNMATAQLRKSGKYNEAAQEMTKGIGSIIQSGISAVETVKTQANVLKADTKYTNDLKGQQEAIKTHKTTGLEAIAQEIAIGRGDLDANGDLPASLSTHGSAIKTKTQILKEIIDDPANPIQNTNEYKNSDYAVRLKTLENKARKTEENYSSIHQQEMSSLDNQTRSLSQTIQGLSNGIVQMATSGLQIVAGDIQYKEGENNANIEMMRSYQEGQSKAVDQARDAINELVRTFMQVSEKYIQSLEGRA